MSMKSRNRLPRLTYLIPVLLVLTGASIIAAGVLDSALLTMPWLWWAAALGLIACGAAAWRLWPRPSSPAIAAPALASPAQLATLDLQRSETDADLSRKDAILAAVNVVAEHLLSATSWTDVLTDILGHLGGAVGASRAFIYEVFAPDPDTAYFQLAAEWRDENNQNPAEPGLASQTLLVKSGFQRWAEILAAGQVIKGNLADFPESERVPLAAQGIRAIIAVPIHTKEHWWGFIGFDDSLKEREWQAIEEDALKVSGHTLTGAIQRQQLFEAERMERHVATELREIANVFSQSLNYDSILDRVLDEVPRIVPYDGANILLLRDGQMYVARQRGYDQEGIEVEKAVAALSLPLDKTPNLNRLVQTAQPLLISDTRADPEWILLEHVPYHSWLGAPLILEDKVEAILSLDKLEPNFYTPAHAARLSLFAGQAGLALRNAQLFAQTMDALERERHLSEITRAITSELDLSSVLQNVVRLAVELAGAEAGSMSILDADTGNLTSPYLYNLDLDPELARPYPQVGIVWETIQSRRATILEDYTNHPNADPVWVAAGIHAAISVPVIAGNTCLGGLGVFVFDPEYRFNARSLALVELVGRQAGIAVRNARLFESAQRRAIEAETLRQAASAVNSALEIKEVLDKILEQLKTVLPYDSASVFLLEDGHLKLKAAQGFPDLEELLERDYPVNNPLNQAIDEANAPVVIKDAQIDPRFLQWGNPRRIHGWIGLPLKVRDEKIGYLTVDSFKADVYNTMHAELAQAFAIEASIAIENARLFSQVQRLAITDPLTGLYNRRYFFEAARREFERARRYNSAMTIIMLDLDHFKQVNDTYGHLAGDRVLMTVAVLCKVSLREVDVLARFGGEEFILLLPQTGAEGGRVLAERLCDRIAHQIMEAGQQTISVSASLGLAELDAQCQNIRDLVERADRALYLSKKAGRARATVWKPDQHSAESIPLHDDDW
jgi:diguanylate cyclase (GGDEF)-like protein